LSGPGVDEILHLAIVLVNSSSEKGFHKEVAKGGNFIKNVFINASILSHIE